MDRRAQAWAASGAMALTGRADGPALGGPSTLVDLAEQAARRLTSDSTYAQVGLDLQVDGLALLGERAALQRLARNGAHSAGGSTRLLAAADGWLALSLARSDDVASLSAWLERDISSDDPWSLVAEAVARTSVGALDERAALLGLPAAGLGTVDPAPMECFGLPVDGCSMGAGPPRPLTDALVVDLSSLWAGPLCGQLLAEAGATVVKVESSGRPDGARLDRSGFFDLLNASKRSVALDLAQPGGQRLLARLLASADVVIESSRPRALEQMGIRADELLRLAGGPQAWVCITSHGRTGEGAARVAFGDVAAVAGGLVAWEDGHPHFLADAVADPLSGLVAAAAVMEALAAGGRWLLGVAMAPLSAAVAGPALDVTGLGVALPRARAIRHTAPPLGADTGAVLGALPA
jgi:hypothetical protein